MDQDHDQFSKPQTGAPWDEQRRQHAKLSRVSLELEIRELEAKLAPRSLEEIMAALSRCLTLTAPSGMSQDDRLEWLTVAAMELLVVPSIVFDDACAEARRTCDHPSKIVPAIMRYQPSHYISEGFLRGRLSTARARLANISAPRIEKKAEDPDERRCVATGMGELLKELQAKAAAQGAIP